MNFYNSKGLWFSTIVGLKRLNFNENKLKNINKNGDIRLFFLPKKENTYFKNAVGYNKNFFAFIKLYIDHILNALEEHEVMEITDNDSYTESKKIMLVCYGTI